MFNYILNIYECLLSTFSMLCIGQPVFEKWLQKSDSETCRKDQLWNLNNEIASKFKVGKGFMNTGLQTDCPAIGT